MINHKNEGTKTIAYVNGCKYDAIRIIAKRVPMIRKAFPKNRDLFKNIETEDTFGLKRAVIKDDWSACVEPKNGDVYNKDIGIAEADKKLINKLEISMLKAIKRWQEYMLRDISRCRFSVSEYRGIEHFKAERMRDAIVDEIKKLSDEQGFKKVVIGISGGKDSTICAALLARALGKNNVYGVLLPDGTQSDISDSYEVVKALGIQHKECNIGKMHEDLLLAIDGTKASDNFKEIKKSKTHS